MKYETTQKYIRAVYGNDIYSVPYCNAQFLLRGVDPFAYNAGVYGWNCDYYYCYGICICTGYRPHGQRIAYDRTAFYENKARKVWDNRRYTYETKLKKTEQLRLEWLKPFTEINESEV